MQDEAEKENIAFIKEERRSMKLILMK